MAKDGSREDKGCQLRKSMKPHFDGERSLPPISASQIPSSTNTAPGAREIRTGLDRR